MLAPLPPPEPRRTAPNPDAVRLDVRLPGGRTSSFLLEEHEFLIGGANGCHLRLAAPGMPPVVCQFTPSDEGLRFRRLAPSIPIQINGKAVTGSIPVTLNDLDQILIGQVEIQVHIPGRSYLSPKLITVEGEEQVESPQMQRRLDLLKRELKLLEERKQAYEGQQQLLDLDLRQEREELLRWREELEQRTQELEEDRAIWYRRRQEMDRDWQRYQQVARGEPSNLSQREAELNQQQQELAQLRQQLFDEYSNKRNQLVVLQETLSNAEAEAAQRRQQLDAEIQQRRSEAERDFTERMRQLEEEIVRRRLQFEDELQNLEPRLVESRLQQDQLSVTAREVEDQRHAIEEMRQQLADDRRSLEQDLQWQRQQLAEQLRSIETYEKDLSQRESHLQHDRQELDRNLLQYKEDLARFDRRQAALEQQQRELDTRAIEVDHRFSLLERESGELEGHVRLADTEHSRLSQEADRLSRVRSEIEAEVGRLADRSAQLESQQATLAILRSKLDRQQEEMRTEASQLAAERLRQEQTRSELDKKLLETERLRSELGTQWDNRQSQQQEFEERNTLLTTTLEDIRRQKADLHAAEERLKQKEHDLDTRSSEIAEQAAILKARLQQAFELQQRLEADRLAVRERESTLSETDAARQEFQEQLRRRSEDLSAKAKHVDEQARQLAEDRAILDRLRASLDDEKARLESHITLEKQDLATFTGDLEKQKEQLTERESSLARQVARLREVGATVAAERKAFFESKQQWEAERAHASTLDASLRQESDHHREQIAAYFAELQGRAPELEQQAQSSLEKLQSAREVLRGQLAELHDYARQTREELESSRNKVRDDAVHLRQQAEEIEKARSEHRLAVTGFRQQVLEWQAKLGEIRQTIASSDTRLGQKQSDLEAMARRIEETQQELERQTAELRNERQVVSEKRAEMERHLSDMRDWYRRKLRELAAGRSLDESDIPPLPVVATLTASKAQVEESTAEDANTADTEPADKHLGELLKSRGFVDDSTLAALQEEAHRQRRSLRQVLLSSGAVTLYQLAIIEAGNMDGLSLGRFRVVDRIRSSPREIVYRVFDPQRPGGPTRGIYLLRHLAEAEMTDAVRPDEFRQRFATAVSAPHPNIINTLEVLDVNARPAAIQESVLGLPSTEWPITAAVPGVWLRLVLEAAKALSHAHKVGLTHGRLAAESCLLTADGSLKIQGFGEPPWLTAATSIADRPTTADLRSLGQIAFAWSQLGSRRRGARVKPFPNELTAVVRRLEIGAEPPMADVVAIDRPYADAGELVKELMRLAESHPCPTDSWEKLLRFVAEQTTEVPPLRAVG